MARLARLHYLAILDTDEIDEAREDELEVTMRMRATDGGRFDELVSGRALLSVQEMPSWAEHEIGRCQRYATIEAAVDPARASPLLRAAETLFCGWAAERDLTWLLDVQTATWRAADAVVPRAFSVEDHFLVAVEAIERAPFVGHLVRTRGLAKFGRPDIGMRGPRSESEKLAEWVRAVGKRGAEGDPFAVGRRLSIPGLPPLALYPRTEDCLSPAPPDDAPLYELREGGLSVVR
jgi:hypothetical protein